MDSIQYSNCIQICLTTTLNVYNKYFCIRTNFVLNSSYQRSADLDADLFIGSQSLNVDFIILHFALFVTKRRHI